MRTLVYKRTHHGDPNSQGVFGCNNCMGQVRSWKYDAVIGIGGRRPDPGAEEIANKVNWIGIGPHKRPLHSRKPLVTFDHFYDFVAEGGPLPDLPPCLAKRMKKVRAMMDGFNAEEQQAIEELLTLALSAPASRKRVPIRVVQQKKVGRICRQRRKSTIC